MNVTGDFSIKLPSKSQIAERYSDILKHHGLIQHGEKPTRYET